MSDFEDLSASVIECSEDFDEWQYDDGLPAWFKKAISKILYLASREEVLYVTSDLGRVDDGVDVNRIVTFTQSRVIEVTIRLQDHASEAVAWARRPLRQISLLDIDIWTDAPVWPKRPKVQLHYPDDRNLVLPIGATVTPAKAAALKVLFPGLQDDLTGAKKRAFNVGR
jgi:hypothetical protein